MSADRLVLEGMVFYGYHGDHPAERVLGRRFVVDVALTLDLRPAGETDDLARTVDYVAVHRATREIVEGERHQLLETVAERLAATLLARFPALSQASRDDAQSGTFGLQGQGGRAKRGVLCPWPRPPPGAQAEGLDLASAERLCWLLIHPDFPLARHLRC